MSGYRLEVATGRSRSGKTWLTAQRVKGESSLLVWDVAGEFAKSFNCRPVTASQLGCLAGTGGAGRHAFIAPATAENFAFFCRCAWLWIRVAAHRGRSVALVVEELADVTTPGKAPTEWGEIVRKALRYNPRIYALTQRPQESDKTAMGNATVLRCHSMRRAGDRRYMATELDVPLAAVEALDFTRKQYIERDDLAGSVVLGGKGMRPRPL